RGRHSRADTKIRRCSRHEALAQYFIKSISTKTIRTAIRWVPTDDCHASIHVATTQDRAGGIEMTPPSNPRLTGGLPQQITVLVVTQIVAVRLVAAWTNSVLKRVPGVVQVLAVVCGLAYRPGLEVKGVMMKAGGCFVGKSVLGCE